mmetsp:Transcript_84972/g.263978  ORF Transcript_84972/g.263978 Transcript_84972/m.263978 type:complete len:301 (+) Transcript_84972:34-936(+)
MQQHASESTPRSALSAGSDLPADLRHERVLAVVEGLGEARPRGVAVALGPERLELVVLHRGADHADVVHELEDLIRKGVEALPAARESGERGGCGLEPAVGDLGLCVGRRRAGERPELPLDPPLQASLLPGRDRRGAAPRVPGVLLQATLDVLHDAVEHRLRALRARDGGELLRRELDVGAKRHPVGELVDGEHEDARDVGDRQVVAVERHLVTKVDDVDPHGLAQLLHAFDVQTPEQPHERGALVDQVVADVHGAAAAGADDVAREAGDAHARPDALDDPHARVVARRQDLPSRVPERE